jgi:nucleoside-diphosphate-sugar epimerase
MNVLITGGAGFIGSELGKFLLTKRHHVTILDNLEYGYRDNFEDSEALQNNFVEDDIRSEHISDYLCGVDVVFHLAGISALPECESNPVKAFNVNCTAVANILNACRAVQVKKFIFASTSAVYENNPDSLPFTEDKAVAPNLIYATTKYCAEQICKSYAQNYGMDITICRFFNVFGPHQDFKRMSPPFTSFLVREALAGNPPTIFNTQDVKRDYIYVDDLLIFLDLIMNAAAPHKAEVFNLASGVGYSALEIARAIFGILGKEFVYNIGDANAFWDKYDTLFNKARNLSRERVKKEVFKNCIGDNSKIVKTFGYSPKVDLILGLKGIVDYQKAC